MNFIPGKLYKIKNSIYHYNNCFYYYKKDSYNPPHSCIVSGEILFLTKISATESDRIKMTFLYLSKEIDANFCTGGDMQEFVSVFLEQV